MNNFGPVCLAFLIATLITALEIITSEYPRTSFLLIKSSWVYIYALTYGLIAALFTVLFPVLGDQVGLQGVGAGNPWIQALIVGVSVKALLHIRLFNVSTGPGKSFPVGVETLVQLFEPWLLRNIELDHFNGVRTFLGPPAKAYPDIEQVREKISDNIPRKFSDAEKVALVADVRNAKSVDAAMEIYLSYVGRKTFRRVFPL